MNGVPLILLHITCSTMSRLEYMEYDIYIYKKIIYIYIYRERDGVYISYVEYTRVLCVLENVLLGKDS